MNIERPANFESPEGIAWLASRAVTALVTLILLIGVMKSFVVMAAGNTGVLFNIWTGSLRTVGQGMAFRIPWITKVQSYPTALRTYTMVQRVGEGSSGEDDSIDL